MNFKIRSYSIYSCKFFFFSCYLFSAFSVYLYTFIAFERWHAVTNPIKYKQKKGKKNQKRIILIFVFCSLISWPFLICSTLQESVVPKKTQFETIEFEIKCEVSQSSYVNLTFLDFLFYNCIPFLFAFLFSNLTLFKLIRFRSIHLNKLKRSKSFSKINFDEQNYNELIKTYDLKSKASKKEITFKFKNKNEITDDSDLMCHNFESQKSKTFLDSSYFPSEMNLNSSFSHAFEYDGRKRVSCYSRCSTNSKMIEMSPCNTRPTSKFKMTVMLMAFPISYIITTTPVFIFITLQLFDYYFREEVSSNYETEFAFSKTIMYLNNSINVLFFILFGKNLRNDFFDVFTLKECRDHFKTKVAKDLRYI